MSDSSTSDQIDALDDALDAGRMTIVGLLSDQVVYLEPHATVHQAATTLHTNDVGLAVVGQPGEVLGVLSERDIVRAVAEGLDPDATVIDVIETDHDLTWATVDSTVDAVAEEMLTHYLRHVLVADEDGELAGVVSMRDVLAAYVV